VQAPPRTRSPSAQGHLRQRTRRRCPPRQCHHARARPVGRNRRCRTRAGANQVLGDIGRASGTDASRERGSTRIPARAESQGTTKSLAGRGWRTRASPRLIRSARAHGASVRWCAGRLPCRGDPGRDLDGGAEGWLESRRDEGMLTPRRRQRRPRSCGGSSSSSKTTTSSTCSTCTNRPTRP
jgi:hypothetical protein